MIRVVIDTNIIVSALLQPLGLPAQVLMLALTGLIQLCITGSVYAEYEEVLRRPKFKRTEHTVAATLDAIRDKAHWVKPVEIVSACPDPDDNMFLECAQTAKADYLVTGNIRHFPTSWVGTRVVTARWLLDIIAAGTGKGIRPFRRVRGRINLDIVAMAVNSRTVQNSCAPFVLR